TAYALVTLADASAPAAIFQLGRRKPQGVVVEGQPAAGGGSYTSVGTALVYAQGGVLAFATPLFGAAGTRGVFTISADGTPALRLLEGASLGGGATVSLESTDELGLDGDAVLLTATTAGAAPTSRALLSIR